MSLQSARRNINVINKIQQQQQLQQTQQGIQRRSQRRIDSQQGGAAATSSVAQQSQQNRQSRNGNVGNGLQTRTNGTSSTNNVNRGSTGPNTTANRNQNGNTNRNTSPSLSTANGVNNGVGVNRQSSVTKQGSNGTNNPSNWPRKSNNLNQQRQTQSQNINQGQVTKGLSNSMSLSQVQEMQRLQKVQSQIQDQQYSPNNYKVSANPSPQQYDKYQRLNQYKNQYKHQYFSINSPRTARVMGSSATQVTLRSQSESPPNSDGAAIKPSLIPFGSPLSFRRNSQLPGNIHSNPFSISVEERMDEWRNSQYQKQDGEMSPSQSFRKRSLSPPQTHLNLEGLGSPEQKARILQSVTTNNLSEFRNKVELGNEHVTNLMKSILEASNERKRYQQILMEQELKIKELKEEQERIERIKQEEEEREKQEKQNQQEQQERLEQLKMVGIGDGSPIKIIQENLPKVNYVPSVIPITMNNNSNSSPSQLTDGIRTILPPQLLPNMVQVGVSPLQQTRGLSNQISPLQQTRGLSPLGFTSQTLNLTQQYQYQPGTPLLKLHRDVSIPKYFQFQTQRQVQLQTAIGPLGQSQKSLSSSKNFNIQDHQLLNSNDQVNTAIDTNISKQSNTKDQQVLGLEQSNNEIQDTSAISGPNRTIMNQLGQTQQPIVPHLNLDFKKQFQQNYINSTTRTPGVKSTAKQESEQLQSQSQSQSQTQSKDSEHNLDIQLDPDQQASSINDTKHVKDAADAAADQILNKVVEDHGIDQFKQQSTQSNNNFKTDGDGSAVDSRTQSKQQTSPLQTQVTIEPLSLISQEVKVPSSTKKFKPKTGLGTKSKKKSPPGTNRNNITSRSTQGNSITNASSGRKKSPKTKTVGTGQTTSKDSPSKIGTGSGRKKKLSPKSGSKTKGQAGTGTKVTNIKGTKSTKNKKAVNKDDKSPSAKSDDQVSDSHGTDRVINNDLSDKQSSALNVSKSASSPLPTNSIQQKPNTTTTTITTTHNFSKSRSSGSTGSITIQIQKHGSNGSQGSQQQSQSSESESASGSAKGTRALGGFVSSPIGSHMSAHATTRDTHLNILEEIFQSQKSDSQDSISEMPHGLSSTSQLARFKNQIQHLDIDNLDSQQLQNWIQHGNTHPKISQSPLGKKQKQDQNNDISSENLNGNTNQKSESGKKSQRATVPGLQLFKHSDSTGPSGMNHSLQVPVHFNARKYMEGTQHMLLDSPRYQQNAQSNLNNNTIQQSLQQEAQTQQGSKTQANSNGPIAGTGTISFQGGNVQTSDSATYNNKTVVQKIDSKELSQNQPSSSIPNSKSLPAAIVLSQGPSLAGQSQIANCPVAGSSGSPILIQKGPGTPTSVKNQIQIQKAAAEMQQQILQQNQNRISITVNDVSDDVTVTQQGPDPMSTIAPNKDGFQTILGLNNNTSSDSQQPQQKQVQPKNQQQIQDELALLHRERVLIEKERQNIQYEKQELEGMMQQKIQLGQELVEAAIMELCSRDSEDVRRLLELSGVSVEKLYKEGQASNALGLLMRSNQSSGDDGTVSDEQYSKTSDQAEDGVQNNNVGNEVETRGQKKDVTENEQF